MKFLVERFLNMSQEDMDLNEKYKQEETLDKIEKAKLMKQHQQYNAEHQQTTVQAPGAENAGGGSGDFGGGDFGGGDFGGGGEDFGGGDFGADMGGGAAEEPAAAETGGGEGGDFA